MKLIMTPPPCELNKNDKNYFYWGVYHWINGNYSCYKIYPNK